MPLILGAASATTAAAVVTNSCRFNIADGSELAATLGTPTDQDTWTCSFWFKPTSIGEHGVFDAHGDASNYGFYELGTNGQLTIFQKVGGATTCVLVTSRLYRDFSAWYHIVVVWDSGNATEADRVIIYTNGTRETAFSTSTYPAQDGDSAMNTAVAHNIGRKDTNDAHNYDGYLAEFVFIDGTAYAASDFGEFDEDSPTIWKPKDPSGLTFGDNGFYLDFEDSADLGADVSGNSHDFTATALTASDQSQDCPSNNFALMNNNMGTYGSAFGFTLTEGNNTVDTTSSNDTGLPATLGMTAGKWYWECKMSSTGSSFLGIVNDNKNWGNAATGTGDPYGYVYLASDGNKKNNNTSTAYGDSYTDADIIGIALDMDNLKLYFAKNNTWQDSGDPTSGATGTGAAYTPATGKTYMPYLGESGSGTTSTFDMNFGNGCFGNTAVASAEADGNGYGLFEYAPPSGYLALCTKNLGSSGG